MNEQIMEKLIECVSKSINELVREMHSKLVSEQIGE